MIAHTRQQALLQLLDRQPHWAVTDLQRRLEVSPATLRRDVDHLARLGRLVRTHGGVIHPAAAGSEQNFARKARTAVAAKRSISALAARLVPDGATVFVDGGTTCLEAGRLLFTRPDVTLYTNSLPLLAEPGPRACRLVAIGGEVREVSRALVGGLATGWLRHLRFDFALLGASGLDAAEGASTTELMEAAVKRDAAARSRRTVLLADATKWESAAPVHFAPWSIFSDLVTDRPPPGAARRALQRAGIRCRMGD